MPVLSVYIKVSQELFENLCVLADHAEEARLDTRYIRWMLWQIAEKYPEVGWPRMVAGTIEDLGEMKMSEIQHDFDMHMAFSRLMNAKPVKKKPRARK